jgi:predicted lipoprotein
VRGLGAIEYVLFDTDPETLAGDARRCEYLRGLAGAVHAETARLEQAWTADDGSGRPYRDVMVGATGTMTPTESIDDVVNTVLARLGDSVQRELGPALGRTTAAADLDAIVEGQGGFGVADQLARSRSMRLVLVGADGRSGLAPMLGDALATRLVAEFDALDAALAQVGAPLRAAVSEQPEAVGAVYDALAALRVTVATEVVSRLGVTVGFNDADGDSAG